MAIGAQNGSIIGPQRGLNALLQNTAIQFAMAATTSTWAARFKARVAKKPKSIVISWGSVSAPGTVQLGVETIIDTTGKPNTARTLYDANATYNITPAVGIQTYTFASLPSANVVVGAEYAVTLRTSVAGTTQTVNSAINQGTSSSYSVIILTSTDSGATWAEVATNTPLCAIIWDDDTCEEIGFLPFSNTYTGFNIYSTTIAGQKIVSGNDNSILGVAGIVSRTGTPAGDLRCRIFDSGGSAISGATVTLDKDSIVGLNGVLGLFLFPTPVSLVAGTYRVIFDSANSVNSSNCYALKAYTFLHSAAVPASYRVCTASDGSADSTTQIAGVGLLIDSQTPASGGVGPQIVRPNGTGLIYL